MPVESLFDIARPARSTLSGPTSVAKLRYYLPMKTAADCASLWMESIQLRAYPAAFEMKRHRHDRPSLCLVAAGRYEESVCGHSIKHGEGHLLFCAADEPHAQRFSREGALKILIEPTPAAIDFLGARTALTPGRYLVLPRLAALARELSAELTSGDDCTAMIVEGLVLETFGLFGRAFTVRGRPPTWINEVRDYLCDNGCRVSRLEDVARVVNHHPAHIAREFKRAFGVTVGDYTRELRVAKAETLLASDADSLAEIADACGFYDQAHLTRTFRRLRGLTPAHYRSLRRQSRPSR